MPGGKKKGNGSDPNRTPFKTGERVRHCDLLAKAAIALEDAREDVKAKKQQFDKIRDAIKRGGYLNDDQLELPVGGGHVDDVLDKPHNWLRSQSEATYHLFEVDAESAHCDAPRPADFVVLRPSIVSPGNERLCSEGCLDAPYPEAIALAKALFGKVGDKPPAMAAARAQAKKKGAGTNGTAEKR